MSSEGRRPSLAEYFDQNYESIQEEISIFIKGFPIISIHQLSSFNDLVGTLIKQNSLLATRFREQIAQIKDNYRRGEELVGDLRRTNIQLESKNKSSHEQIQGLMAERDNAQNLLKKDLAQLEQLKQRATENQQASLRTKDIGSRLNQLRQKLCSLCFEFAQTRPTRVTQSVRKRTDHLKESLKSIYQQYTQQKASLDFNNKIDTNLAQFLQLLQDRTKEEKSKHKLQKQRSSSVVGASDQIFQAVSQFSIKSKQTMRVLKLTDKGNNLLGIVFQSFGAEIQRLETRMEDLRNKLVDTTGGRKSIDLASIAQVKSQRGSFESALLKVVEVLQKDSTSKPQQNQIRESQKGLMRSLGEVKGQCQKQLKEFSEYLHTGAAALAQQMKVKEEMNEYYEKSLLDSREQIGQSRRLADGIANQNLELNKLVLRQNGRVLELQSTLQELRGRMLQVGIGRENAQREKYELEFRLEESVLSIANPLKDELVRLRGELERSTTVFLSQKQELLTTINDQKAKSQALMVSLVEAKQSRIKLTQKAAIQGQQAVELSKMLLLKDKVFDSLGEMVRELETKVRCQAIDLRGRDFQLQDNDKRIGQLISENHNNMSLLRNIRGQMPDVIELNNCLAVTDQKLLALSEENLRLKTLLKETKTQLGNSRRAISDLSQMMRQHQSLKRESETSSVQMQRCLQRARQLQGLYQKAKGEVSKSQAKVGDLQKYQVQSLTLQAQNNRLLIEIRHMKSVLGRISEIKEFI